MSQQTWSLGIKLFGEITNSVLLSERLKNCSSDSERLLSAIGKTFSRHLNEQFSHKLIPNTLIHTEKYKTLDDLVLELEFVQNNQQQSFAFDESNESISDFFEGVLVEAAKVIDEIHQKNSDFPELVTVSSKPSQNGIQTKSVLCAELVNKLRRTNIKMEPVTFVLPSGKTLDMHLKGIQNHRLQTSEKQLTLTGRMVDFSDIEKLFKLQENGMRLVHKITTSSLSIEARNNLLDAFKAFNLITVTVRPRIKLIGGSEEPNDYEFIDFSIAQQKIT
ncbi:hypothetical protein [Methylophaga pinxianii]|uniref:hypothetical protein n=1 Tax=Methylophaga pinxianii TaxID=2881052 RepID=UPI001CF57DD1|nr:hypothetical protein [Methylophaga pinxianii]MCB2425537.1 hypothetical protein [Methylophaga pinxianii]UPH46395.1 hypothetical protein LGT42_003700 [Methylophaga pinxianii]